MCAPAFATAAALGGSSMLAPVAATAGALGGSFVFAPVACANVGSNLVFAPDAATAGALGGSCFVGLSFNTTADSAFVGGVKFPAAGSSIVCPLSHPELVPARTVVL